MTSPYSATVLEHFRRPRNHGSLERPTVSAEASNPLCGDRVRVEIEVVNNVIVAAGFTANACAICTAAASLLTEHIQGMTPSMSVTIGASDSHQALGSDIPAAREACAALPWRALRDAVRLLPE